MSEETAESLAPTPALQAESADTLPTGWGVPRHLLVMSLPIIASMISRTVMGFTDFLFVSKLGTEAQAAIMPAHMLVFCVISFGMGTISAVNTFVSQSFGAKRPADCGKYGWQGLYVSAIYAALLLPVWFLIPGIFRLAGHSEAVLEMEIAYAQISLLTLFPSIAIVALADFFNGIHKPMIGLWSSIAANGFNVLANAILMFGIGSWEGLGFIGSALGTLAATYFQTAILLGWMLLPKYHRQFSTRTTWGLDWPKIRNIVRVGLPAGIQMVCDVICFTIFTLFLMGQFGTAPLAANNLVFQLLHVAFMPTVGLSVALTAMVGKAIGMGRKDYARLVTRWAMGFAMAYMGSIAVLYVTMPYTLVGILTPDPEVQYWATRVLFLCAVFQLFDAVGITHLGALRGAGDNVIQAVLAIALGGTLFIPGGYLMAYLFPQWGILGPWTAATVYIMAYGSLLAARWWWGPWERIDLLNPSQPEPAGLSVEVKAA